VEQKSIGIRPGEKLHEQMIGIEDATFTYEYDKHYKILPQIHNWSSDQHRIKDGKLVPEGFSYSSDNNSEWMNIQELREWIQKNKVLMGNL
jgi:FlaA1/EpsC-like NDP-sugar epimerase